MITAELLDDWLEGTRCSVNEKHRVKAEYSLPRHPLPSGTGAGREPMRYLLHGPPGTVRYVKDLLDLIGLRQGVDWEIRTRTATPQT